MRWTRICAYGKKGNSRKKEESQLFIAIWYGRFICRCRCRCIIHIYRMPDTLKSIHATENPNNFCLTNYIHARTSQRTICTYCTVYCYIHMLNLKYFEYYTVCYISIAYLLTRLLLPSFNPQNWCDTDKYLHTRTHTHARIHEHIQNRRKSVRNYVWINWKAQTRFKQHTNSNPQQRHARSRTHILAHNRRILFTYSATNYYHCWCFWARTKKRYK